MVIMNYRHAAAAYLLFSCSAIITGTRSLPNATEPSTLFSPPTLENSSSIAPLLQSEPINNSYTVYWESCPHESANSYFNFSFNPYPIKRNQMVNITMFGNLNGDVPTGTYLTMFSSRMLGFLPGPSFRIDVCDFIAEHFPDQPNIRCPISQWAVPLILRSIAMNLQRNQTLTDGGEEQTSKPTGITVSGHCPWFILPGDYKAQVELRTADSVLTCSKTTLRIV